MLDRNVFQSASLEAHVLQSSMENCIIWALHALLNVLSQNNNSCHLVPKCFSNWGYLRIIMSQFYGYTKRNLHPQPWEVIEQSHLQRSYLIHQMELYHHSRLEPIRCQWNTYPNKKAWISHQRIWWVFTSASFFIDRLLLLLWSNPSRAWYVEPAISTVALPVGATTTKQWDSLHLLKKSIQYWQVVRSGLM